MTTSNQTHKSGSSTTNDTDHKDKHQTSTDKKEQHDPKKHDSNPSKQTNK